MFIEMFEIYLVVFGMLVSITFCVGVILGIAGYAERRNDERLQPKIDREPPQLPGSRCPRSTGHVEGGTSLIADDDQRKEHSPDKRPFPSIPGEVEPLHVSCFALIGSENRGNSNGQV